MSPPRRNALGGIATFLAGLLAAAPGGAGQEAPAPDSWPQAPQDSLQALADSLQAAPGQASGLDLLLALAAAALLFLLFHNRSS